VTSLAVTQRSTSSIPSLTAISRLATGWTATRACSSGQRWCKDGWLAGGKKHFGWIVPTWINAKNGFGGYTGEQLYVMFFFDDKVTDATDAFGGGLVKSLL
jgi:hypothetical protein